MRREPRTIRLTMRLLTMRALRALHRTAGRALPGRMFALTLPTIPGRVHVDDLMLRSTATEHIEHYRLDRLSAIDNLQASLGAVGQS